jgi:ABC-type sugar transport system permease subunit
MSVSAMPSREVETQGLRAALTRVKKFLRKYAMAYLFIAVPMISFIVFLLIPMLVSFWWSLNDFSGLQPPIFVGLKNYIDLFTSEKYFLKSLWNTTVFVLLGMGIGPSLGLLTALLLNEKVHFRSFFRTVYYLPVMTSLVVVSTIWVMLYNQNGLFNSILTTVGLQPVGWLSDPNIAMVSVAIASIWQGFGFETVIFLAALQSIPQELYEAAMIDGASSFQRFLFVTIPSLRYVIAFVYIYGIIGSYQAFDQIFVMTNGGPLHSTSTVVYFLYSKFQDLRLGQASAVAYILFAILVIFSAIQMKLTREKD